MINSIKVSLGLLINRLALGVYLFLSGYIKIFERGLSDYVNSERYQQTVADVGLPDWLANGYGYTMPFLELAFGALLAFGLLTRVSAAVITLLLIIVVLVQGVDAGDGSFNPSIVFATLAAMFIFTGPGRLSVDAVLPTRRRKTTVE